MTNGPATTKVGSGDFTAVFSELWCADFKFRADRRIHLMCGARYAPDPRRSKRELIFLKNLHEMK
jgi:hypothetical protein